MLDEVYSRNKFKIQDIRAKIKENKVCNFTNMPRNVIQLGISSEYELAQTHPGDISVPSILDMAQRHPEFTSGLKRRLRTVTLTQVTHVKTTEKTSKKRMF